MIFGACGSLGLVSCGLLGGHPELWAELALAACAYSVSIFLLASAGRLPPWAGPVLLGLASGTQAVGVAVGGGGPMDAVAGFFYLWVAVHGFGHLSRRLATAELAWGAVAYGTALVYSGAEDAAAIWAMTVAGAATAGAVVSMGASELRRAARLDHLTGVGNRGALVEALSAAVRGASPQKGFSVLVLDLDGLKEVNDRWGHPAGDELLKEAARAWREALGEGGVLFRPGGDEFVALLPGAGPTEAEAAATRLLQAGPAASLGAASWALGESAEALLARADAELYRAKGSSGRREGSGLLGEGWPLAAPSGTARGRGAGARALTRRPRCPRRG